MFRHRKRLILKRLNHLIRLRKFADQLTYQKLYKNWNGQTYNQQALQLAPQMIPLLTPEQRKRLRRMHKNLPAYVFMTDQQKQQYFKRKSQEYQRKITVCPQRVSKNKKIVKFTEKIDVRPFMYNQRVKLISRTESIEEPFVEEGKQQYDS